MNAFDLAATILIAALAPLLAVTALRRPIDGLVAVQLAGTIVVLALLCLSVGLGPSYLFTVPIVAVVASWLGGMVFARFLGRWV